MRVCVCVEFRTAKNCQQLEFIPADTAIFHSLLSFYLSYFRDTYTFHSITHFLPSYRSTLSNTKIYIKDFHISGSATPSLKKTFHN